MQAIFVILFRIKPQVFPIISGFPFARCFVVWEPNEILINLISFQLYEIAF